MIPKSNSQGLNQEVSDWDKSVRPSSFRVQDGQYICNFDGAAIDSYINDGKSKKMGVLSFVCITPVVGKQIRITRFLSAQNKEGVNYGIGQFLDEIDTLRMAYLGQKPIDRSDVAKRQGAALDSLCAELNESRPKNVVVIAETRKTDKGPMHDIYVGIPSAASPLEGAIEVGDTLEYDGKAWTVTDVDGDVVTLKSGKKTIALSRDQLVA